MNSILAFYQTFSHIATALVGAAVTAGTSQMCFYILIVEECALLTYHPCDNSAYCVSNNQLVCRT